MTAIWAAVPAALIVAVLEVTLILAAACVLDRIAASRVRPRVRAGLWTLVLIRLLLPPGLVRWPQATIDVDALASSTASGGAAIAASGAPLAWLGGVWAAGAIALAWLWIARTRRAHRRLRPLGDVGGEPLPGGLDRVARRAGLTRTPALFVDAGAVAPYVTGLWSPRLVLPFDWHQWPARTLRHAVAHECTHLARRDLWAEAAWMAATAIYWFHPLAHVARRRAHDTREMCCDADIAQVIGPDYRSTLLRVVATAFDVGADRGAAPARHGWHPAIARLRALERWPAPPPRRHRLAGALLFVLIGGVVVPSHVEIVPRVDAAVPLERLIDPVSRQELGMGSLHLRYALLRAQRSGTSGDPPAPTNR